MMYNNSSTGVVSIATITFGDVLFNVCVCVCGYYKDIITGSLCRLFNVFFSTFEFTKFNIALIIVFLLQFRV